MNEEEQETVWPSGTYKGNTGADAGAPGNRWVRSGDGRKWSRKRMGKEQEIDLIEEWCHKWWHRGKKE